jgi:PhnB protein
VAKKRAAPRQAANKVHAIPAGYPVVTPGFQVAECRKAIEFLKTVFGAKEKQLMIAPNGSVAHCELKIGDSIIMCGDPMGPDGAQTLRAMLYVKDCDTVFSKALEAGAKVKEPLSDRFWGDRTGRVIDPCGNEYLIATHKENVSAAEMDRRMKEMMSSMAAPAARPAQASPPPPPPMAQA